MRISGREIVLRGGCVMDPEPGYDAVADVAIAEGRFAYIGAVRPPRRPMRMLRVWS